MNMNNLKISEAWKVLIKPQRMNYSVENLGPQISSFEECDCYRKDFVFTNNRGNKIHCSIFIPCPHNTPPQKYEKLVLNCPCVIYNHSQSGNRIEGMFLQNFCIRNNYGLCVWDFNSCGKSEGEYVTLGWREQDDLEQLINIVTKDYKATQISLWGRSMGAVTSVLYAQRNSIFLSSMILDSPFSDIEVMVKDVAYQKLSLPGWIVSLALKYMSSQIKNRLNFNILKLKPINFVKECSVPCVFIIGKEDELVLPKRIKEMHLAYGGQKKTLLQSDGDHSSERESSILNKCFECIFDEFKYNINDAKKTQISKPLYVDQLSDNFLDQMAQQFSRKIQSIIEQRSHKPQNYFYQKGRSKTYNFDNYVDRNAEYGYQVDGQEVYHENVDKIDFVDEQIAQEYQNLTPEEYNKNMQMYSYISQF